MPRLRSEKSKGGKEVRECTVCYNKLGKVRKVVCPGCNYETCPPCVKKYFDTKRGELKCMKCELEFTKDFICGQLGVTFLKKDYRRLREEALYEHQQLYMVKTQEYTDMQKKVRLDKL